MDELISRQPKSVNLKIEKITKHRSDFSDLDEFEPSEHRWIPVSERLPDEGIVLVACGKDGDAFYVAPADAARESAYAGYVKAWMQIVPW